MKHTLRKKIDDLNASSFIHILYIFKFNIVSNRNSVFIKKSSWQIQNELFFPTQNDFSEPGMDVLEKEPRCLHPLLEVSVIQWQLRRKFEVEIRQFGLSVGWLKFRYFVRVQQFLKEQKCLECEKSLESKTRWYFKRSWN